MDPKTLKDRLIKIGESNPKLRPHLRPVLDTLGLSKTASRAASTLISLRVGDYVEVTTSKYGTRTVEVTGVDKVGPRVNVYVSSGKTRPGHTEGGTLQYHEKYDEVTYQPTLRQNVTPVKSLKKLSGKPRLSALKDDSIIRDLLSISSGSLNSMLGLDGSYAAIDTAQAELVEFAQNSPKNFRDWREVVKEFKKRKRASFRKTAAGESLFETIQEFCNELARVSQKLLRRESSVVAHRVGDASCHTSVTHKGTRQRFKIQYGIDASEVDNPLVIVTYIKGEEILDTEKLPGAMEPTDVAEESVDRLLALLPASKSASLRQRRDKFFGVDSVAQKRYAFTTPLQAAAQLADAVEPNGINFFAFDRALEELMRGILLEILDVPAIDDLWQELSRYVDGAADAIKRDAMHESPNTREVYKAVGALERGISHLLRYNDSEDRLGQAGLMFLIMRDMLEAMSRPRAAKLIGKAGKALDKHAELIAL